ncbi:MAG: hypothetical protein ACI841_000463 [Planctomycetota bacterium]|jgi:hypothetical protein
MSTSPISFLLSVASLAIGLSAPDLPQGNATIGIYCDSMTSTTTTNVYVITLPPDVLSGSNYTHPVGTHNLPCRCHDPAAGDSSSVLPNGLDITLIP